VLASLLRIAVGLDRNHAGRVRGVSCREADDGALVVEVSAVPGADVSLELYAANQRTDLLAEVTGRAVTVVPAVRESDRGVAEVASAGF
jgi:hypothetical protein